MFTADETHILREVLAYLSEHQDAEDTLEGIVEWWLLERRICRQTATVKKVLSGLVQQQLVLERRGRDDRVRFRLNPSRLKEITAFLDEVKPAPRRAATPLATHRKGEAPMPITVTNKAEYLLILQLNDGQSVYLSPGETSAAIDEGQISGNEKFGKLLSGNLVNTSQAGEGGEAGGEGRAGSGAEARAASAEATAPGTPEDRPPV